MEVAVADLSAREQYKFLVGAVVPRPIGWISTISRDGVRNVAPFSFFNAVCSKPMTVAFSPNSSSRVDASQRRKDTLANIEDTGEFVVNVVTEALAEVMNETSAEWPGTVDEFDACGIEAQASVAVRPPRVAASPIHFECVVRQILRFGDFADGGGSLVVGEVVHVHVDDALMERGRILIERLKPVGRLAGDDYARVNDLFELHRPNV